MEALTATATLLPDDRPLALTHLVACQVTGSVDSPAASAFLTALLPSLPGDLASIQVQAGGEPLFQGRVDRQRTTLDGKGLLLDNEAVPCALCGVGLATVFERFVAPYGFSCYNPGETPALSLYTVRKGLSEWEAFATFVSLAHGLTPYVEGDQVIVQTPRATPALVFSGGSGELPYSRLVHTQTPYQMVSRVYIRDGEGRYGSWVDNPAAQHYQVQRKRYLVPGTEFTNSGALDANQRIRQSMLDFELLELTAPGLILPRPGQEVRVLEENLTLNNWITRAWEWSWGASGLVTRLFLAGSVHYR